MAINIFQGTSKGGSGKSRVNSASNSSRAAAAKAALSTPSVTSDSGSTAVGKTSTLSKVGNFIGKAAGIASKFLPGVGGTIAKGISNIFNDPEWWQSVPGDAATLNTPLRQVGVNNTNIEFKFRYSMAEFCSTVGNNADRVMRITPTQATQYLMPEIRKVVNAVALQTASDYSSVLEVNATLYAIWQQLKKYQYLLQHGQTYLANMDDPAFPLLRVQNAAFLKSTIGRIEEFLRSNVRLPHTLCEYLAWRFGRVYKSNTSAKSGLIMYNVWPLRFAESGLTTYLGVLMSYASGSAALQAANADLYNAFYDHDQAVEISEDTQLKYDVKEFCLRTNSDVRATIPTSDNEIRDCVYIDSAMDNPTTFMASTVSTVGIDAAGAVSWLFPVRTLECFMPLPDDGGISYATNYLHYPSGGSTPSWSFLDRCATSSIWAYTNVTLLDPAGTSIDDKFAAQALGMICALKALDIYNKDIYVRWFAGSKDYTNTNTRVDISTLSMDMGLVPNNVLGNEHVYAFANLVHAGRKHSMSYKEAETLVSRDTANLVEKLDIASVK